MGGIIDSNDKGQSSQRAYAGDGHHSPDGLITFRDCQGLPIKFLNLLGQTGLGKEQRRKNVS